MTWIETDESRLSARMSEEIRNALAGPGDGEEKTRARSRADPGEGRGAEIVPQNPPPQPASLVLVSLCLL